MKITHRFVLAGCLGPLLALSVPTTSLAAPARAKTRDARVTAPNHRQPRARKRVNRREMKRRKALKRKAAARAVPAAPDRVAPSVGASTKRFDGPRASDSINPAGPSAVPNNGGPVPSPSGSPMGPTGPSTGTPVPLTPVAPAARMISPSQPVSTEGFLRVEKARFLSWGPGGVVFATDADNLLIGIRNLGARKVKISCAVHVEKAETLSIAGPEGATQTKPVTPTSGVVSFWVLTKTNSDWRSIRAANPESTWTWRSCVIDKIQ